MEAQWTACLLGVGILDRGEIRVGLDLQSHEHTCVYARSPVLMTCAATGTKGGRPNASNACLTNL